MTDRVTAGWAVEYSPDQRVYHVEALDHVGADGVLHASTLDAMRRPGGFDGVQRWYFIAAFRTAEEANEFADALEKEVGRP